MSPEEFWHGDPFLAVAYRKAEKLRWESKNWQLWLQGAYVADALNVVLGNAFGKKGSTKLKYPKEPYKLAEPEEDEDPKVTAEQERKEQEAVMEQLKAMLSVKKKG